MCVGISDDGATVPIPCAEAERMPVVVLHVVARGASEGGCDRRHLADVDDKGGEGGEGQGRTQMSCMKRRSKKTTLLPTP